jgi:hypothetical protein
VDHHHDDAAEWLTISYMDDEDDLVLISSDADVEDAVMMAQKLTQTRVKLYVHDTAAPAQTSSSSIQSPTLITNVPIVKVDEPTTPISISTSRQVNSYNNKEQLETLTDSGDDEDMEQVTLKKKKRNGKQYDRSSGTPQHQDLLLPAAIAFLGVVIIGVFTYSRVNQS